MSDLICEGHGHDLFQRGGTSSPSPPLSLSLSLLLSVSLTPSLFLCQSLSHSPSLSLSLSLFAIVPIQLVSMTIWVKNDDMIRRKGGRKIRDRERQADRLK